VVPVRASMGCPHRCNFCSFNKDHRLTHIKPLDSLIDELKAIQERGVKYVWFVDDNFRLGKNDLESVCRRFVDEEISLEWMCLMRPEILKEVDLTLLRQAGCREVQMGLESADPGILSNMNKQSDPALNERVIKDLISAGINCAGYFIFGYPGETDKSIGTTFAFIKRLEEHDGPGHFNWSLYPFLLWPFSPIFDQRGEHDLDGYFKEWRHQSMDSAMARRHVFQAFMALDNSGPIYRGDNLDQLSVLSNQQCRLFLRTRHDLERLEVTNRLDNKIAIEMFAAVFLPG
jgi:anaerobic magnesium-protoporphyrin IX monomethyl ester cyclase